MVMRIHGVKYRVEYIISFTNSNYEFNTLYLFYILKTVYVNITLGISKAVTVLDYTTP